MTKRKQTNPATHKDDPILTPEAVGRIIGTSGNTVRRWIREKLFHSDDIVRKPNDLYGIRLSAVRRHLSGTGMVIDNSRLKEQIRLEKEAEEATAKTAEAVKRHKAKQADALASVLDAKA